MRMAPVLPLALAAALGVALGVALVPASPLGAQTSSDPCIACHLAEQDERLRAPATAFANDVHASEGFGCLVCHGTLTRGSPDPTAGFLAAPTRQQVPGLCARCHSDARFMRNYNPNLRVDQLAEYLTSTHGQRLVELNDPDVATCTDCHPAHGIRPPDDPESMVHPLNVADLCGSCHADPELMGRRGHDFSQLEDYRAGIHGQLMYEGGDLSAPTCNDCHGNHGAAPPGLESVQNVCGECHVGMAQFFEEGSHADVFAEQGLPGCATCHENHRVLAADDELLGPVSRDVCSACHTAGDPHEGEFERIGVLLASLEADVRSARDSLNRARGMGMEVEQALFELEDVNNALTLARTAVHSFQVEPVRQEVENGRAVAGRAQERALSAFGEHRFRRVGLTASAILVAILIVGLWLRIREFDLRLHRSTAAMRRFYEVQIDPGGATTPLGVDRARIAAATLLIELAEVDVANPEKRAYLAAFVREQLERGPVADEMVALAERQRTEAMDVGQVTQLMADNLGDAQKSEIADAIWDLVLRDPELARLQGRFLLRVPEVLALSRVELEAALERVQERAATGPAR